MADKQPVPRITIARLRNWRACYSEAQLVEVFGGRKQLTPLQLCDLGVPAHDKLWVLLRPEIIPMAELRELALVFVRDVLPPADACKSRDRQARRQALRLLRGRPLYEDSVLSAQLAQAVSAVRDTSWVVAYRAAKAARVVVATYVPPSSALQHGEDAEAAADRQHVAAQKRRAHIADEQLQRVRRVLERLYGKPKPRPERARA